jgi:hypothetical protein
MTGDWVLKIMKCLSKKREARAHLVLHPQDRGPLCERKSKGALVRDMLHCPRSKPTRLAGWPVHALPLPTSADTVRGTHVRCHM